MILNRYDQFSQDFGIFIMFVISNEIKNQSPIRPVENSPIYNEEKINQIRALYDS